MKKQMAFSAGLMTTLLMLVLVAAAMPALGSPIQQAEGTPTPSATFDATEARLSTEDAEFKATLRARDAGGAVDSAVVDLWRDAWITYYDGFYEDSARLFSDVITIAPDWVQGYVGRSIAYITLAQNFDAVDDILTIMELDPDDVSSMTNLGFLYNRLADYEAAVDIYDQILTITTAFDTPYNNRAFALNGLGRYEEALADYNEAVRLDPMNRIFLDNRAVNYSDLGEFALADIDTFLRDAVSAYDADDYAGAESDATAAIEALTGNVPLPTQALAFYIRGRARVAQGDDIGALADYNTALDLDQQLAPAFTGRAWVLNRNGDLDAARDSFVAAHSADPEYGFGWLDYAVWLERQGEVDEAAQMFWQWLEVTRTRRTVWDQYQPGQPFVLPVRYYGWQYELPFEGTAGEPFTASAIQDQRLTETVDALIVLLDSNGNPIAANDDGAGDLNSLIDGFVLPRDGRYTLVVGHAGGGNSGLVELQLSVRAAGSGADITPTSAPGRPTQAPPSPTASVPPRRTPVPPTPTVTVPPVSPTPSSVPASPTPSPTVTPDVPLGSVPITTANAANLGEIAEIDRAYEGTGVFSADGSFFYEDGSGMIGVVAVDIDAATSSEILDYDQFIQALAVDEAGALVAAAGRDEVVVWDTELGIVVIRTEVAELQVVSLTFNADASLLAYGLRDGTVGVLDIASESVVATLEVGEAPVYGLTFSPDGDFLLTGDNAGVQVWNTETWESEREIDTRQSSFIDVLVFNAEGTEFASGSWDGSVVVVDFASGQPVTLLLGHQDWVRDLAFSPDGSLIASASDDDTVRVWDATGASGSALAVLRGHRDDVRSVTFSEDGQRLYSASRDGTIRVWGTR